MGDGGQEEGWVVCRIFKKKNHHKTLDRDTPIPITTTTSSSQTTSSLLLDSCNDGALEQIIQYMGRTCKEIEEDDDGGGGGRLLLRPIDTSSVVINSRGCPEGRFSKLPSLESPNSTSSQNGCYQPINPEMGINSSNSSNNNQVGSTNQIISSYQLDSACSSNWAAFDRLVASQLNGQMEVSNMIYYGDQPPTTALRGTASFSSKSSSLYHATAAVDYTTDADQLWSFARLSSSLSSPDPLCHVSDTPI